MVGLKEKSLGNTECKEQVSRVPRLVVPTANSDMMLSVAIKAGARAPDGHPLDPPMRTVCKIYVGGSDNCEDALVFI